MYYMDHGIWEEQLEAHDAEPHHCPTTQGELVLSILYNGVIGSCYLVKHGQIFSV